MNLQQLNGSGQSVVDFVLTALLALIITGLTWYILELVNECRKWQESRYQRPTPKATSPMPERIGMIVWLLRNGLGLWMIRTGAWWRILFNSKKRFYHRNTEHGLPIDVLISRCSTERDGNQELSCYYPKVPHGNTKSSAKP